MQRDMHEAPVQTTPRRRQQNVLPPSRHTDRGVRAAGDAGRRGPRARAAAAAPR